MAAATIGVGAGIGTVARWGLLSAVSEAMTEPVTLAINVAGSLLVGLLLGRGRLLSESARRALATGFAGGFTTFSTFALQVAEHIDSGAVGQAAVNAVATPALALLAAGLGFQLGRIRTARRAR